MGVLKELFEKPTPVVDGGKVRGDVLEGKRKPKNKPKPTERKG